MVLVVAMLSGCKSREEQLEDAEEDAKFMADKKAAMVKGLGEALKGRGAEGAQSLGEGVGDVLKGVAKGIDTSLGSIRIESTPAVAEKGLHAERANQSWGGDDAAKDGEKRQEKVSVYLIYDKPFQGELVLRALEKDGKEVGRAFAKVEDKAGGAGYVDFPFDDRTPLKLIDRVELGVR
jgi:hypothetical protein